MTTEEGNNKALIAAITLVEKTHAAIVQTANSKAASDIASAIVTNDIAYIKSDMREIKDAIKTMKDDYVTRRELADALKGIEDQIKPLKNIIWGLVGLILSGVIGAILKLVIL